jgi:hypothetical protein
MCDKPEFVDPIRMLKGINVTFDVQPWMCGLKSKIRHSLISLVQTEENWDEKIRLRCNSIFHNLEIHAKFLIHQYCRHRWGRWQ